MTPKISRYCPHHPTDKQTIALVAHRFLPADEPSEVFYGGAAFGGKSDWLLMGALEHVDVPGYAAIIFRKTFTDLALPGAIMARSHEWLSQTDAHWTGDLKQWSFPSGATLQFAYLKDPGDELRYQSAEFQYVGFDELTQFMEGPYRYLFSRLRRPAAGPLSEVLLRMCAASNPGGVGHGWVKKRFPIGRVPVPGGPVFVSARLSDNPHGDQAAYRKSLAKLDDVTRRQLEDGDWSAAEGLAYPNFQTALHVIDPFPIPAEWDRFEFMDHGLANPAAWYPVAVDHDGNLVIFDEYYSPAPTISAHCSVILERREAWYPEWVDVYGVTQRGQPVTIADPSTRRITGTTRQGVRLGDPATEATEYLDQSDGQIVLIPGNNDPRAGRARIVELLRADPLRPFPYWHPRYGELGAPRLFIIRGRCPELVDQLEVAPLLAIDSGLKGAGEIVDPAWEGPHGHAVAALRYGAMSRPGASGVPEVEPDDPRAEVLARYEQQQEQRDGWGSWGDDLRSV